MTVAIIGAGPAGLMASGTVKSGRVTVLERNEKAGKKLYITGKGRCNFSNNCQAEEFLKNVVTNANFLHSALNKFSPQDAVELIEAQGCKTKEERGRRLFPLSDHASDITRALTVYAQKNNAQFVYNACVSDIKKRGNNFEITYNNSQSIMSDRVIIASGGCSYPQTGSNGALFRIIEEFGHKITPPKPSLTSFVLSEDVSALSGLTLKNIKANIYVGGKEYARCGDLLFTHNGVSGPVILTLSALICRKSLPAVLTIDLKPALDGQTLDKRLLRDFERCPNKLLKNTLEGLMPKALIPFVLAQSKIQGSTRINVVTKAQRAALLAAVKGLSFKVGALGGFDEAVVTSGGVDVLNVNPKSMESKIVKGLFFAGEVLDVDALTGGYNIQIAMSTGYCAGLGAGEVN